MAHSYFSLDHCLSLISYIKKKMKTHSGISVLVSDNRNQCKYEAFALGNTKMDKVCVSLLTPLIAVQNWAAGVHYTHVSLTIALEVVPEDSCTLPHTHIYTQIVSFEKLIVSGRTANTFVKYVLVVW